MSSLQNNYFKSKKKEYYFADFFYYTLKVTDDGLVIKPPQAHLSLSDLSLMELLTKPFKYSNTYGTSYEDAGTL